jgi:hypothetical protein
VKGALALAALIVLAPQVPAVPSKVAVARPAETLAPVVSDDVKRAVSELQVRASGLAYAIATLQKELDATTMPLQRTIQQAQATCAATPGYQLAPTLTCVKEPAPSTAEKK